MLQFILRRLGLVIPTFIGITLLTFAFVHMIPGDPVMIMAGERGISPERHAQLLAEMGLDKPLWQQYAHYIWGVLHGDLGISLKSRIPVWQEFVPRFKATLELGVCAMIFAVAVGIPVGVLAAVKRGSIFDHTAVGLALTGYSMPIFWWGMMLIMLVSVQLNLTPVSGRISDTVFLDDTLPLTGFMLIDTAIWGEQGDFIDALMHMILPAIVLGTIPLAVIVRMTRSSMLEVLGEDYIRTARAKGLTRMRVIVIHALRNAMLPVVTVIGLQVGTLLAGAILTETIFSWPGLGRWLIDALQRRDYPVVQGGVLLVATMIILVNLLVDLLYGVVNPRMMIVIAVFANFLAPYNPADQFRDSLLAPPFWQDGGSMAHLLGTDDVGRDILSRLMYGARLSLLVGCLVVVLSLILGVVLGLVAGYFGGVVDSIIIRVVDIMLALPSLLLALVLVAIFGPSIVNASLALTFVALPHYVRLTRAAVLVEVNRDYVTASRVAGAGAMRQMFVNILPNCLAPLIVQASLGFSNAILDMAALGFLGMGAQPPTPEWGTMLSDVLQFAQSAWWVVTFPGVAILLTVLAFNLMGDGLRDALDPKLKQ
ncbi:MAG: dipeptide ABC transporter permease DppB [Klebsiella pneumoniae]|nr:dipeptide ABC transporter permease DppB [Klebsiella pneumoniae]